jgi:hypothetical protein
MALLDVYLKVGFLDSAERISEVRYLLREQYDTATDDLSDVATQANALETALDACTWDHIQYTQIEIVKIGAGAAANVAANNQVRSFSRILDVTSVPGSIEVPAWDDLTFDQDHNNLLSTAYNVAIAAVALQTRNPDTGENWALAPQFSQSRTRKSGIRLG